MKSDVDERKILTDEFLEDMDTFKDLSKTLRNLIFDKDMYDRAKKMGVLSFENPLYAFEKDTKTGVYDGVSDEKYVYQLMMTEHHGNFYEELLSRSDGRRLNQDGTVIACDVDYWAAYLRMREMAEKFIEQLQKFVALGDYFKKRCILHSAIESREEGLKAMEELFHDEKIDLWQDGFDFLMEELQDVYAVKRNDDVCDNLISDDV